MTTTWRSFLAGALAAAIAACCAPLGAEESSISDLVGRLRAVGPQGAGNEAASAASQVLARLGPEALLDVLRGMDGAGPAAVNWLGCAADAIAERALARGEALPVAALESFLLARERSGPARRLAYDWLARVDSTAPERLVPGMLDDPAVELRREAVARELAAAEALGKRGANDEALAAFRRLFPLARDRGQIESIAKRLEERGDKPDLSRHFGFVRAWRLIGPFDNVAGKGFAAVYAPEERVDLEGELAGKLGPVRWLAHATEDRYGVVDLNKALGKHQGAVAYAHAEIESPVDRPVELRAGTDNALKVWLNGALVFNREEYHHGMNMDQHRAAARLRAGRNTLLLKICQNEQEEDWAQDWSFQLRACDLTGGGIQ